ncbi:hypothetical protein RvY_14621 [Ramazzottius varieornatus]|uniref:Enoyl-CoA hydratase domain-containing protein 3, mitochondrial n=1 Tax=Ramazzottius varieornatus TaxID=947166 RepID=A0A1D1VRX2_RAMVA|nr:hypothetical protein RvY_14621 [Ramazzottius varieornatus]
MMLAARSCFRSSAASVTRPRAGNDDCRQPWKTFMRFPSTQTSARRVEDNGGQFEQQEDLCLVSTQDGIQRIILNNVKKRNVMSLSMMRKLLSIVSAVDQTTKTIVISANGPVFSSGHDLKELRAHHGKEKHEEVFRACADLMCAVEDCSVPVIAEVKGLAAAAGLQLCASCDIVVASSDALFSVPGVNNGLFCSTPGIPLVRSVPRKIAAKMLFTGDPITAKEALQAGLVSSVVEKDLLEKETTRIAMRICEKSREVIILGKKFLRAQAQMSREQAYRNGSKTMVDNLALADGQEGITAFVEKRKPRWA